MQYLFIFTALLLIAGISAEHNQEVSNVQTGPQVDQPSHVAGHSSAFESGPQQAFGAPHHHQHHQSTFGSGPSAGFEAGQPMAAHYYSPAGIVQVVGGQQQQQQQSAVVGEQQPAYKPTGAFQAVRHYSAGSVAPVGAEQYGQPESAGVPPNYKPFGSWGLYIGGNPADGYYTNYYKALSGSVADKQQAGGDQATAVAPVAPTTRNSASGPQTFASNFGPVGVASPQLKQGPFYPGSNHAVNYQDQSYQGYPYGEYYTPADLNSGSRVTVQSVPSSYSSGPSLVSSTSYSVEEPTGAAMFYAGGGELNSGKKSTGPAAFGQREVQVPASPAKGYYQAQQRTYYAGYQQQQQGPQQASGASSFEAPSSGAYQNHHQQQSTYQQTAPQVVAYPVPVGSQLVGSQPGVDGAFQPYGVHAFTRYAVKPTVVSPEQSTYYQTGAHSAAQFPVYRQYSYSYPQPLGFYGYPISQLHYASGVSSAFAPSSSAPGQVAPGSPAAVAQQQQQQQQQHAAAAAAAAVNAPHPGSEPAPAQAPAPGPVPAQGATVVVDHSGPGPAGPVHAPVAFFEAASSEKSETSQKEQVSEKKAKVQPSQQQQSQKSN